MKRALLDIKPRVVKSAATGNNIYVVDIPSLLDLNADVYIIFGMRSFGKTYSVLQYCIDNWIKDKQEFVYMRTLLDDVLQGKIKLAMGGIKPYFEEKMNHEAELTVWQSEIISRRVINGAIVRERVGAAMSLSGWLKHKGQNYDNVTTVLFDEFIEQKPRLSNEDFLTALINNLSTIIRYRDNVKVFYLANTIRQKSPVFDYYKINVNKITKGQPLLFSEENGLRVCVYWTPDIELDENAIKHYTVTGNENAKMITNGEWAIKKYPTMWNGIDGIALTKTRTYRQAQLIYISDYKILIHWPHNRPPIFEKINKLTKEQTRRYIETTLPQFYYLMPTTARALIEYIKAGYIISINADDFIDIYKTRII